MRKILMALAIAGSAYFSADAQVDGMRKCEVTQNQVCRKSSGNEFSCYKTKYAENFKVCKGNNGYFICCETPNYYNSTHPEEYDVVSVNQNNNAAPTPASPAYSYYGIDNARLYEGYYPENGKLKACYSGNNVAKNTQAPYKGCPSPQDDGPEKNNYRNMNVVAPENQ